MMSPGRRQQPPRQSRPKTQVVRERNLCQRCRGIRLDEVFQSKPRTEDGKIVCNLGPLGEWSTESCTLCHLMFQIISRRPINALPQYLRVLSSNKLTTRGWRSVDTTMLAVVTDDSEFLLRQTYESPIVRLIQPDIDPELVKYWLRYCENNHSKACNEGNESSTSKSMRSLSSQIPSFKVIDCTTRRVVNGCEFKYVALSYVWGVEEDRVGFSRRLTAKLPNTIEDAIKVTQSLGMRYLWVDRYCINQSIPSEVQEQVKQMDLVYSCAYLTIIAAAGTTPHYGLPGVGGRKRRPQPHGIVQGEMLISTLPDPREEIKVSKWYERGWTYQEGILSPRRLVFTESQIYYECKGMYCCEAINLPLQSLHTQNGQRFRARYCEGINTGLFPKGLGTSEWEIVQRIENYTRKELTDPSDILNGISGILQAFARSRKRVLNCAGVPMIPRPAKRKRRHGLPPMSQEWSPLTGFCLGLCWAVESPAERHAGFPSWSWTGWRARINWGIPKYELLNVESSKELNISVQLDDGRVDDLKTFCDSYHDPKMKIISSLHIATWVFPMLVQNQDGETGYLYSDQSYAALLEVEDEGLATWSFEPTTNQPIPFGAQCFGMTLCQTVEGEAHRRLYVLVIRKIGDGLFERVGFGDLEYNTLGTVSRNRAISKIGPFPRYWQPLPVPKKEWKEFQLH